MQGRLLQTDTRMNMVNGMVKVSFDSRYLTCMPAPECLTRMRCLDS